METIFYDEPTLLTTATKSSLGLHNTAFKLNLCTDGKNLDFATRREEIGFGDLADFLGSPDIGISSPDLENLVWKEWSGSLRTPGSLPEQQPTKPENCEGQAVTKEQEVFAFGFTEALKKLQETERLEKEISQEEGTGDSSECSDSGSHEESYQFLSKSRDAKITFISYTFDSQERLPSFQEAFSKPIIKKSKESEICLQIKTEASEDIPANGNENANDTDDEWDNNCSAKDVWDRVETVDEGFCSRKEMPVHFEQNNYLEHSGIPSGCAINPPFIWDHSNDFNINNSDFFKDKSTVEKHLLEDFSSNNYGDGNYIHGIGRTSDIENIGDLRQPAVEQNNAWQVIK